MNRTLLAEPSRTRLGALAALAALLFPLAAAAQATWLNVSPLKGPAGRSEAAMAYDSQRHRVVLFGGSNGTARLSDTWEWNGFLWTQMLSPVYPPARNGAAMVYDEARRQVLLFGGFDGSNVLGDTWAWDGYAWTQLAPGASPKPRYNHAMAFDSGQGVAVLFGGYDKSSLLGDTWIWDGATWTRTSSQNPQAQYFHSMAYDAARGRTVLFSGYQGHGTWEWDGKAWNQPNPANSPNPASRHAMTFDRTRGRIVLFGGYNNYNFDSTWEWDGKNWAQLPVRIHPPARSCHGLAYDAARRRAVLFGGTTSGGTAADTWELVHDCRCVGEGHLGGGLPMTCLSPPVLGGLFRVAFPGAQGSGILLFGGAPAASPWLAVSPPLLCRPGSLWFQPWLSLVGAGDPVIVSLPVPLDPSLAGTAVCLQGLAPQLLGCLTLTDAVEAVVRF